MNQISLSIVILLVLVLGIPATAEEPLISHSTRLLSMGGIYASLPGNTEMLGLNPASLESVEDSKLTLISFALDINGDAVSTASDFLDAYGNVDTTRELSHQDIDALVDYDPHLRMKGPFQISYVRSHWGFTLMNTNASLVPDFSYGNDESKVSLMALGETTAVLAYGQRVYRNLSAGLSLRYQLRTELLETDVAETTDDDILYLRRGLGYDLGFLYAPQRWPLHIGLAYHDVFNTSLAEEEFLLDSGDSSEGTEGKISQQLRLGITYEPNFRIPSGKLAYYPLHTLLSLEFGAGDSFGERLHIGAEVQLFRWFAVRFGINSGVRLGVGLHTQTFFLDYMFASSLEDREGVHSTSIMWRY